jgi:F-type H+-transporting ATPase subunit gamma
MPNVRDIKKHIRSVGNIGQVTRALEAVSVSRARRAQAQALSSRAYAQKAWEVLINVASQGGGAALHPLLEVRSQVRKIAILLISGDRGLAGAYNANVIRVATEFACEYCHEGCAVDWVTVGRVGRGALLRRGQRVIAEFSDLPSELSIQTVGPVARMVIDEFLMGMVDQVFIAYTDFLSTLVHTPVVVNLLPLQPFQTENSVVKRYIKHEPVVTMKGREYLYEPSAAAILEEMLPRFTALQIYQAILESQASEHSARMIAMLNASENAEALAADLQLSFHKARQLTITSEILDIVGGVEALRGRADKTGEDRPMEPAAR